MEHKVNDVFDCWFVLKELVGVGAYSEVWLAMNMKVNMPVVLKLYVQSSEDVKKAISQWIKSAWNIRHKNILLPLSYNVYGGKPYIVLPYCQNGSISRHVGTFSEEQTWRLLCDVADGLSLLHNMTQPISHQHLIPSNILIGDDGDYIVSDFAVYSILTSTYDTGRAGNCTYKAPELFDGKAYMASSDIYSLGVIAYEMITGEPPFGDFGALPQLQGEEIPYLGNACSDKLRIVIEQCLKLKPQERPTAYQLHHYGELALTGQIGKLNKLLPQERKWYQLFQK